MSLRTLAQEHLLEMQMALQQLVSEPALVKTSRADLLQQARSGQVLVIDVRPPAEFDAAHLPYARSLPLAELEQRISELPINIEIVAYCRGPFCVMSDAAVKLLLARGYRAKKTTDGISEWQRVCHRIPGHHNGPPERATMNATTLFVLNHAPYGNERTYNTHPAAALAGQEGQQVRLFLMADAVGCAKTGQKVPEGYYNTQLMLGKIIVRSGFAARAYGWRGFDQADMMDGAHRRPRAIGQLDRRGEQSAVLFTC